MRPPTSRPLALGRAFAVAVLVMVVLAAPASAGLGPETSHSENADAIRTSYWVMFAVAFLVAIPMLAGLLLAVRRFRAHGEHEAEPRRTGAGPGVIGRVGAALGVVAAAIFVFGVVMTGDAREAEADDESEAVDINVVGQQWLWRFEYPGSASEGIATVFSYNELVVPVDTTVNLRIDSTDVLHRWFIPALGGQVEAVPGEIAETSFRADSEGVYPGQSTLFSGTAYPAMRAWVRVVSAEEYEQYLSDLTEDLQTAQEEVAAAAAEGSAP